MAEVQSNTIGLPSTGGANFITDAQSILRSAALVRLADAVSPDRGAAQVVDSQTVQNPNNRTDTVSVSGGISDKWAGLPVWAKGAIAAGGILALGLIAKKALA